MPPSPSGVAYPSGSAAMKASAPARRAASATSEIAAPGAPRRIASPIVAPERCGLWGTHARCRRQASPSTSSRSMPPTSSRPSSGPVEPQEQARDRALSGAARPDQRDAARRKQSTSDASRSTSPCAPGIRERHVLEAHGHVARVERLDQIARLRRRRRRRGLLERVEDVARSRDAVGARVELRRDAPQRGVQLGREHQDRQRRSERHVTAIETDADLDRDDGGAERRGELEHEGREERDPQRAHRLAAVVLAGLGEDGRPGSRPG